MVLFARYASVLAGRGHAVTLLVPPVLVPLMGTLRGIEKVASAEDDLAGDKRRYLWTPLKSTMGMLHLTADAVPAQPPYLSAEPERAARWGERLSEHLSEHLGAAGPKVGLVWRDAAGAAPLAAFAPLAAVPGLRLISLQKGPAAAEIAQAPFGAAIEQPLNANDASAEGVRDLAAVVAHLDLVVGVDSLAVHLAGALGKPVFLALDAVPDWRWLMSRDDTPWYAGMRLFRQEQPQQWPPVFERMAEALR
jgi:hypothetical protein